MSGKSGVSVNRRGDPVGRLLSRSQAPAWERLYSPSSAWQLRFVPKYNLGTSGNNMSLRSQAHENDRDVARTGNSRPCLRKSSPARKAEAARVDWTVGSTSWPNTGTGCSLSPDFDRWVYPGKRSRQLAALLKNGLNLEVMASFAGYGLGPDDIQGVLGSYLNLGVDNVLVVRGDPPHRSA